jgi:hypothetical protein
VRRWRIPLLRAIEQHFGRLATELSGEDPAVVGQDLLGDAMDQKRLEQSLADSADYSLPGVGC